MLDEVVQAPAQRQRRRLRPGDEQAVRPVEGRQARPLREGGTRTGSDLGIDERLEIRDCRDESCIKVEIALYSPDTPQ